MNAILPTRQTQQPDRAGLSHYEILADGLIHAAAVFDIAPDERFVERVTALAWANGVQLARRDVGKATEVARLLGESLEVGRSETLRLCEALTSRVDHSNDPFGATRSFYQERHNTQGLNASDPAAAGRIRQLVGEARWVNLPAAFSLYLSEWNPNGLSDVEIRNENVRIVAERAFKFAFGMGLVSELLESFGGKCGEK